MTSAADVIARRDSFIPLALLGTAGLPLLALVAAAAAATGCLASAVHFGLRALRSTASRTLLGLAGVASLGAVVQLAEAGYVYVPADVRAVRVVRNWAYAATALVLALVQLQLLSVFSVGLMPLAALRADRLWMVRTAIVAAHVVFSWPTYLEGIAFVFDSRQLVSQWQLWGTASFGGIVALSGVVLNLAVLRSVERHVGILVSSASAATQRAHRNQARAVRGLILALLVLDVLAVASFAASAYVPPNASVHDLQLSFAWEQLSVAIAAVHLAGQGFLLYGIIQYLTSTQHSGAGAGDDASGGSAPRHGQRGSQGQSRPHSGKAVGVSKPRASRSGSIYGMDIRQQRTSVHDPEGDAGPHFDWQPPTQPGRAVAPGLAFDEPDTPGSNGSYPAYPPQALYSQSQQHLLHSQQQQTPLRHDSQSSRYHGSQA
ncbi:hypothetical protein HK105_200397 [Polyrhizophydium stewartii]|uniref:Uncharacterized protein n=1 Tax=Polyrhizophydium stewartii TaxID=2732419 RepID=A0ABR4NLB2_9FUNG|nr:hypothetical protein HK105_003376 [Polyrhizophydium stewartii]